MTGVKLTGYPRIYPRIKIRCPTTTRHSTRCGTLHTLKVCPCSVHLAQGKQWRAGNKLKISWKNLFSRWKNAMALSTVKKNKAGWRPRMVREVSILDRDAAEASRRRGHLSCPPQSCPESLKPLPTPDPPPGPEAQVPAARSQPGPHDFFLTAVAAKVAANPAPRGTRGAASPGPPRLWARLAGYYPGTWETLAAPARDPPPPAAARVGRGRDRDKAAGRGPHLSSQKVQGECSGTPPASGRRADSGRPTGSPAPGGAAAGGSAMFSAGQAADARTREPGSLPAPAPPRAPPRAASALPQPNKGQPARAEQGTRGRRAEEQSPGWPHSWDLGQMEDLVNGSVRMESQSPTVRARKESGLDIPTI